MDHVVYLDARAKELENLLRGRKTMILRGAMGRKLPYKKVVVGDHLYFLENKGDMLIKARGLVTSVYFSEKLTYEESFQLVDKFQYKLLLNTALKKRFAGKRYLTLITVTNVEPIDPPLELDKSDYSKLDDWLIVEMINQVIMHHEL